MKFTTFLKSLGNRFRQFAYTLLKQTIQKALTLWRRSVNREEASPVVTPSPLSATRSVARASTPKAGSKQSGSDESASEHVSRATLYLLHLLRERYDFRYNRLEEQVEYRLLTALDAKEAVDAPKDWRELDEKAFHKLIIRLQLLGCTATDNQVRHAIATLSTDFHPFGSYLAALPKWDGHDYVAELAARISPDDREWTEFFSVWMRAMVAQWMDYPMAAANQVAPILVSLRQGFRKSSFCRLLLPPQLRELYTDKFDLTSRTQSELSLYRYGLINMDEFDRYTEKQHTKLKNLLQLTTLRLRSRKQRIFLTTRRVASLIGTSNSYDLLTDPSGSRRFYCQEVKAPIDLVTPIPYTQLYAQLVAEVKSGLPLFFSKEQESRIETHNRPFQVASSLEEAFFSLFKKANPESDEGRWMTTSDIYEVLRQRYRSAITRAGNASHLGRRLTFAGLPHRRVARGSQYYVKQLTN